MSRSALELERLVKEMQAKERSKRKAKPEADVENEVSDKKDLNHVGDSAGVETSLSRQEEPGGNSAAEADGNAEERQTTTMAKKKSGAAKPKAEKKAKAPKAPKAAKAPKEPKAPKAAGERKPRGRAEISGRIVGVQPSGLHALSLEFESGKMSLAPTANRDVNRDLAVKAIKELLKG